MDDGQGPSADFERHVIVIVEINLIDNHLIEGSWIVRSHGRNGRPMKQGRTGAVVQVTQQSVRGQINQLAKMTTTPKHQNNESIARYDPDDTLVKKSDHNWRGNKSRHFCQ